MASRKYCPDSYAGQDGAIMAYPSKYKSSVTKRDYGLQSWTREVDKGEFEGRPLFDRNTKNTLSFGKMKPNANKSTDGKFAAHMQVQDARNVIQMIPQDGKKRIIWNNSSVDLNAEADQALELELRGLDPKLVGINLHPSTAVQSYAYVAPPKEACVIGNYSQPNDNHFRHSSIVHKAERDLGECYKGIYDKKTVDYDENCGKKVIMPNIHKQAVFVKLGGSEILKSDTVTHAFPTNGQRMFHQSVGNRKPISSGFMERGAEMNDLDTEPIRTGPKVTGTLVHQSSHPQEQTVSHASDNMASGMPSARVMRTTKNTNMVGPERPVHNVIKEVDNFRTHAVRRSMFTSQTAVEPGEYKVPQLHSSNIISKRKNTLVHL